MRAARENGRTNVLPLLTARCARRLQRLKLLGHIEPRRAEAHAIRILLRRVGTRTTIEKILARWRLACRER